MVLSVIGLSVLPSQTAVAETRKSLKTGADQTQSQPVAVVELFTSEGCSSCPSADNNLARISKTKAALDRKVLPLSFHVDYWNRLGWKDPFSQAAFSERQHEYSATLKNESVYTPQMIVNGTSEFIGSNQKLSDRAILNALATPPLHNVSLSIVESGAERGAAVKYSVSGDLGVPETESAHLLNIAVVSDLETVSVARGENGGQKLSHVWVVKSLEVVSLDSPNGSVSIDPAVIKKSHTRIVAYVQSATTRQVTGAAALDL